MIKRIVKGKRAQIFGMSFEMIFSILLAAVFLIAAFFAIKHFLDLKKCGDMSKYMSDFQNKIDELGGSEFTQGASFSSPTPLTAICFINVSKVIKIGNQDNEELIEDVYNAASHYSGDFNAILWPLKTVKGCIGNERSAYRKIAHIALPKQNEQNPLCFFNVDGVITIGLEKRYESPLVNIVK